MGGVTGSQGLGGTATQLVQNTTTIPNSSFTTGLVVTATSIPLGDLPEKSDTTPGNPGKAGEKTVIATAAVIDVSLAGLQDKVHALVASVADLVERWTINGPLPLNPDTALEVASIGAGGMAEQAIQVVQGNQPGPSSGAEDGRAKGGWERAWVIVMVTTSLITEAYGRWQGSVRPSRCRPNRSRRGCLANGYRASLSRSRG